MEYYQLPAPPGMSCSLVTVSIVCFMFEVGSWWESIIFDSKGRGHRKGVLGEGFGGRGVLAKAT